MTLPLGRAYSNLAVLGDRRERQGDKAFVKGVLADEASEYYGIVSYFMEFHRDDLPEDMVKALFPVEDPSALTLTEMADYLQLKRFGSFLDEETKGKGSLWT